MPSLQNIPKSAVFKLHKTKTDLLYRRLRYYNQTKNRERVELLFHALYEEYKRFDFLTKDFF